MARACLKIPWGPAAGDFGGGQGGEAGASPQRAVTAEPTRAAAKRSAARRVFAEKAAWLRCSSVTDPCGYAPSSRLALQPFPRKQDLTQFSDRLLRPIWFCQNRDSTVMAGYAIGLGDC